MSQTIVHGNTTGTISYLQVAWPAAVGFLDTVGISFGAYPRYEDGFVIELGIGRHPGELPGPLYRVAEDE